MDNREFLSGYVHNVDVRSVEPTPEHDGFMEGPHRWMGIFNDQLVDYLAGKPMPNTEEFANSILSQYNVWTHDYLDKTLKIAMAFGLTHPEDKFRSLMGMNFHLMTEAMAITWLTLIGEESFPLDASRRGHNQTFLAMAAADLAFYRKMYMSEAEKGEPGAAEAIATLNGMLTEIDTAIALEELAKESKHANLAVIAAPLRFESGERGERNADLLVIDRALKQVRGYQAKVRIGNINEKNAAPMREYDSTYVTMIDGVHDLGNTAPGPYLPGRGRLSIPAPGLIAMDHLQRISIKDTPFNKDVPGQITAEWRTQLMRAKSIARELSKGRKSYIGTAVHNIRDKVLYDLYVNGRGVGLSEEDQGKLQEKIAELKEPKKHEAEVARPQPENTADSPHRAKPSPLDFARALPR